MADLIVSGHDARTECAGNEAVRLAKWLRATEPALADRIITGGEVMFTEDEAEAVRVALETHLHPHAFEEWPDLRRLQLALQRLRYSS